LSGSHHKASGFAGGYLLETHLLALFTVGIVSGSAKAHMLSVWRGMAQSEPASRNRPLCQFKVYPNLMSGKASKSVRLELQNQLIGTFNQGP
jgi:hypothetical protein